MASLLNCELLEVGGRSYRVLAATGARGQAPAAQQHHYEAEEDEREEWGRGQTGTGGGGGFDGGAEEEASSVPIHQDGDGFVARMRLDAELIPFLIGRGGSTKARVEQDTGARVQFPGRGAQGPATIRAPSRAAVARACTQLELLVGEALKGRGPRSLDYNYFVSLPLANPDTCAGLERFRDTVLAEPGTAAAGLEPSVFMHPQHLHLTLCMLKLYSEEQRELARHTLRALGPRAAGLLGGAPLAVRLKGLEYMTDDPSQMHVVYLQVADAPDSPGGLQRLQQLCKLVVEAFGASGLLLPQDDRAVKLHATVINTRYRRRASGAGQQQGQRQGQLAAEQRQPFDGRQLLQSFGELDLGTVQLPAVHLSQRGRYDTKTGFYQALDSLPLL